MKTEVVALAAEENPTGFAAFFRASLRELTTLHRANQAADAEIRKLQSSTRKKLDRIGQNLRHVQTTR